AGLSGQLEMTRVEEGGDTQWWQAALAGPEQVAGTTQGQVFLRDGKPIGRSLDHLQPAASNRIVGIAEEYAEGPMQAAAHPSAQLLQLGEAEALRVLDEHDRCIRHV